jgi:DNA polymerase-3 subunit delta'
MTIYSWNIDKYRQLAQRANALPHALLFKGPPGIGKRAFADAVAKGLLCEKPVSPIGACNACAACHWFDTENHPDYRVLQPEIVEATDDTEPADRKKKRDISVAQVRSLAEFINISAHRSGAKVVVIQPAEAMNVNAANALLKSLEEPPSRTYFLLVSDRSHLLPATLRSRCQQIELTPPGNEVAAAWLAKSGISRPELALAQAGGAPVLAVELDTPDYWALRQQFLEGVSAREFDPLGVAERFAAHPIPQFINWMQRWSYDLASISYSQRVRYNPDWKEVLCSVVKRMKPLDILRFHRELVQFQRIVNHPLNPRLLLEDLMLRYAQLICD